jgi:hypothetical protein
VAKTDAEPKTLKLKCYFCGGPLTADDAHLEIYDQEEPPFSSDRTNFVRFNEHGGQEIYGRLVYPGNARAGNMGTIPPLIGSAKIGMTIYKKRCGTQM